MAKKPDRALTRGDRTNLVTFAELGDKGLKAALFVLDQFGNQSAGRWPMVGELASCMCCPTRMAQYAIKRLRKMGIIDYHDEIPGQASRQYSIDYDRLMEFQPEVRTLAFHPAGANRPDDSENRGADSAPHAVSARGANTAPHAGLAPHANAAPQNRPDDPQNRGAGSAPPNIQTRSVEDRSEQNTDQKCAQSPVCLLGSSDVQGVKRAQQLIRAKLKAAELLKENLVWNAAIGPVIELAAQTNDGNPLPRVMEVVEMADLASPKIRGAWIKEAIEKGWKPKGRRGVVSA